MDEAGGGEPVFAEVLVKDWDKIVITDPKWRPHPDWRVEGGFGYGKTNPTVLERCYFDHDGVGYSAASITCLALKSRSMPHA